MRRWTRCIDDIDAAVRPASRDRGSRFETHGNCSAEQASINALRVLEAVGAGTVPVALGLESPLDTPHKASWVHGHDGLADIGLPLPHGSVTGESAPDQLVRLGNERPGELDLIAVGALTNLAAAMQRDPEVLHRYRSVTWLGGVSRRSEPADGFFDANALSDPDAAAALFQSDAPITVVQIDLSYQQCHRRAARCDPHGSDPQSRFAWQILPFYCDFYEAFIGRWSACMHDTDCRRDCDRSEFRNT